MSDKNLTLAALLIVSLVAPTPLITQSSHDTGQSRAGRNQENSPKRDDVYQRTQNSAGSSANMIKRDDDKGINQGRTMQGYADGNLVAPSKKPVTIKHYYP